jgi:hypothetical protein
MLALALLIAVAPAATAEEKHNGQHDHTWPHCVVVSYVLDPLPDPRVDTECLFPLPLLALLPQNRPLTQAP